jgi:hypothetical protein
MDSREAGNSAKQMDVEARQWRRNISNLQNLKLKDVREVKGRYSELQPKISGKRRG